MSDSIEELLDSNNNSKFLSVNFVIRIMLVIGIVLLITGIGIYIYYEYNNDNIVVIETVSDKEPKITNDIYVDISGAVKKPGLYKFSGNIIRISDVIEMSEGIREDANKEWVQKKLNLAKVVKDQEKIYIPFEIEKISIIDVSENTESQDQYSAGKLVNINSGSLEELMSLPKIGEVTAKKIIEQRDIEKFSKIEDLLNVDGIGESTLEKIRNLITVE